MARTLASWLQVKDLEELDDSNVVTLTQDQHDLNHIHKKIGDLQRRIMQDQIEIERLHKQLDDKMQEIGRRLVTDVRKEQ